MGEDPHLEQEDCKDAANPLWRFLLRERAQTTTAEIRDERARARRTAWLPRSVGVIIARVFTDGRRGGGKRQEMCTQLKFRQGDARERAAFIARIAFVRPLALYGAISGGVMPAVLPAMTVV